MPSAFARHWTLDPQVDFLNHGSFGATPRPVLAAQQAWRDRIEAEPVRFFARDFEAALDDARASLGAFVGADPDDLAFVPNATAGTNAVLRSLQFDAGDELLTTDHAYNAARNTLEFVAARDGARVVVAPVPFPIASSEQALEAILAGVTSRTRLALIDHVTSATALIFPVESLVRELTRRGIETLVDGAHAPGALPVAIEQLGATFYVANLHKWVCAPKGAGLLWVAAERQMTVRPLAISHGANSPREGRSRFRVEFDWTGTADPTPYLAVPEAIRFGEQLLDGGWQALRTRNRALALSGAQLLREALQSPAAAPDEMLGPMVSVPLPLEAGPGRVQGVELYDDPVHADLIRQGIQVMVTPWPQRPDGGPWQRLVRISAAAYNDLEQYRRLAELLPGALAAATAA